MQQILLLLCLLLFSAHAQVTLTPSPTDCAVTKDYTSTFSSTGVVTLDIVSTVSAWDEFMLVPSVGDDQIVITTTAISDTASVVNAIQIGNTKSQTTLSVAISYTGAPTTTSSSSSGSSFASSGTSSPTGSSSATGSSSPSGSTTGAQPSNANIVSKSVLLVISSVLSVIVLARMRPSVWMLVALVVLCAGAVFAANCGVRAVVKVAVPATVHTVCFNGVCHCNCAVRGTGVNIHFTQGKENVVNTLANTGFGTVRMDFFWAYTETTRGSYNFAEYDFLTANLTDKNDMIPYYILDYGNPLYGTDSPRTTDAINAFAKWAANATTRFRGKNIIWEMWNEPNHVFWKPEPKVADYVALGLATGQALKSASPSEVFIGPASAGFDQAFVQDCFDGGMLRYWDAVSVHFYRGTYPETVNSDYAILRKMIRVSKPADKVHIGILSGEWGYTTSNTPNDARMVTEEGQAQYVVRQYMNNLANDVPISIWYDFIDDGVDGNEAEYRFGLFRNQYYNNRPQAYDYKPSGMAVASFYRLLRNLRFNKRMPLTDPNVFVTLFDDGASKIIVAFWTPLNVSTFQLPVSSGASYTLYNIYGNVTTNIQSPGNSLQLIATKSPQYLVLNTPNEALTVLAKIPRLPIEMPACNINHTIPVKVPNPTNRTLSVKIGDFPEVSVAPGQTAFAAVPADIPNGGASSPAQVLIRIAGLANLTLTTTLICDAAISVSPALSPSSIYFTLLNPSGFAFSGSFVVGATSRPLNFARGQKVLNITIALPTGANITDSVTVTYSILDSAGNMRLTQVQKLQQPANLAAYTVGTLPNDFVLTASGNASVGYTATATIQNFQGLTSFALQYSFQPGWKYIMMYPRAAVRVTSLQSVGMWVYGDNSGNALRSVFVDATGQNLQYTFGSINFVGWNYMYLNISTQKPGFWDGANNGIPTFPLRWANYFLVDSAGVGNTGTLYITLPTIVL